MASGRWSMVPLSLLIEADLRLLDGDVEGALVLLGAVEADPGSNENDHQEVQRFLDRVDLDDEVVRAGMAAGAGQDFQTLARSILDAHPAGAS